MVSQLPVFEIDCPMKNSRKLRFAQREESLSQLPSDSSPRGAVGRPWVTGTQQAGQVATEMTLPDAERPCA